MSSLDQEDPLEKEMATHSSILAWRIPWTEEPGGLQFMRLQRIEHNWVTEHAHACGRAHTHTHTQLLRGHRAASLRGFTRRSVYSLLLQSHWAASCGGLYLVSPWSSNHLRATPSQSYPQASGNGDWQGEAPLTFTNPSQAWNWSFNFHQNNREQKVLTT